MAGVLLSQILHALLARKIITHSSYNHNLCPMKFSRPSFGQTESSTVFFIICQQFLIIKVPRPKYIDLVYICYDFNELALFYSGKIITVSTISILLQK